MTKRRVIIVHIGTSADGYIARPDGDLEWLTSRPKPKGFYGMSAFMASIDTKLLGRKTYEMSLRMGAKSDSKSRTIVFSRHAPPADAPSSVEFVNGAIGPFVSRLREQPGKDIWLMGGGELICTTAFRTTVRDDDQCYSWRPLGRELVCGCHKPQLKRDP